MSDKLIYTPARAKRLILEKKLPKGATVGGWLDLRGCDLSGVTLPTTVSGSLYLRGCDLSGVTLPTTVSGSLDLRGCDLSGVTLPTTVGGWLDLRGCDLSGVTSWWKQGGEETARRCIAVSDYALIQTETGQYTAGCRGPWSQSEALAHWGAAHRKDARAKAFVAAIKANPAPIAETAA